MTYTKETSDIEPDKMKAIDCSQGNGKLKLLFKLCFDIKKIGEKWEYYTCNFLHDPVIGTSKGKIEDSMREVYRNLKNYSLKTYKAKEEEAETFKDMVVSIEE